MHTSPIPQAAASHAHIYIYAYIPCTSSTNVQTDTHSCTFLCVGHYGGARKHMYTYMVTLHIKQKSHVHTHNLVYEQVVIIEEVFAEAQKPKVHDVLTKQQRSTVHLWASTIKRSRDAARGIPPKPEGRTSCQSHSISS
jgi:hypothetical protein